jgi:hypothetical protein
MNLPVARVGMYLLLSVLAVAAVAGGMALSRRASADVDREHACWGASAG